MTCVVNPVGTITPVQDIVARHRLARDALLHLGIAAAVLASVAAWLVLAIGGRPAFVLQALGMYILAAWLVWRGLHMHPHDTFGPANRVTLVRLTVLCLLTAIALQNSGLLATVPRPWGDWALVVLATVTALLDVVDGALARRSGMASAFGARFDMETDAAFILVLCVIVVQHGQVGPWILAAGFMRYAFVAAAWIWPWLAAPLKPSKRRQIACVAQITALIICLAPVVSPALASALGAASLAGLTISFAIDIRQLAKRPPTRLKDASS